MDIPGRFYMSHIHQPEFGDVNSPVKKRFLSTVKRVLQIFDEVGLSRHAEEPLLGEASLADEVHALLHQQRGQALPIAPLVLHRVLQALPEDPCTRERHRHLQVSPTLPELLLTWRGSLVKVQFLTDSEE